MELTAVWNGTVGGTPVEDPIAYSFKIRASTCGAEALPQARNVRAQTENCLTAQAEVAMGVLIDLILRSESGSVLARSGSSRTNQTLGLAKVYSDETISVDAQGVPDHITSLVIRIKSRPSGKEWGLLLLREGGRLTSQFSPRLVMGDHGKLGTTVFSSIDWSTGQDPLGDTGLVLDALLERDASTGGTAHFGANPKQISDRSPELASLPEKSLASFNEVDLAEDSGGAFYAGGYEVLQFEVNDEKVRSRARVLARFANGANTLMLSGHGSYTGFTNVGGPNIVLADRTGPTPSNSFQSKEWSSVRTIIAAGCVVCNLNDYALNSKKHVRGVGDDFFEKIPESSPARTLKGMIHPNGKILGYQDGAPEAPNDQPPIKRFLQKMKSADPAWKFEDPATARLWVEAHGEVDFLDNASAMDNDAFYFIQHSVVAEPPRWTILGTRQRIHHKKRVLVKAEKSNWNKPLRADHTFIKIRKFDDVYFDIEP